MTKQPHQSAVKTEQLLGYARVRVLVDLARVRNTVESGNYLYYCADWSIVPWSGWKQVCWSILARVKMGCLQVKLEGKFYDKTTTPECSEDRTAACAEHCVACIVSQAWLSLPPREGLVCETTERGEDGKWALCMHTICVHIPHTHIIVWVGWIAEASEAPIPWVKSEREVEQCLIEWSRI